MNQERGQARLPDLETTQVETGDTVVMTLLHNNPGDVELRLSYITRGTSYSQSFGCQHFSRRRAISGATNPPGTGEILNLKSQLLIEFNDTRRRLIRQHHGSGMSRQPLRGSDLIVPAKTSGAVGSEFDVVRWVGVDEIFVLDLERANVAVRKAPVFKDWLKLREAGGVRN